MSQPHRIFSQPIPFQFLFLFLFLTLHTPYIFASTDANYLGDQTLSLTFAERAQAENGYASGFSVTDFGVSDLFTPNFEMGTRIRFIGGYGPASVLNFATYNGVNTAGPQAPTGFDRPI